MIFKYIDYRVFLKNYLKIQPKHGHGQISKIAKSLGVSTTHISQVLMGIRSFTQEQSLDLAEYLGLSSFERDYFLCLLQVDRAGKQNLKKYWLEKATEIKKNAEQQPAEFEKDKVLSDAEKSIFYSNPIYSAIRLFMTTNDKGISLDEIVKRFDLERQYAIQVLNFLVEKELLIQKNFLYFSGPQKTHLEAGSPYIRNYHSSWRLRSISNVDTLRMSELMYTAPVSISKKDFENLREEMHKFIKSFLKTVHDSPAEDIACFNMDWFWVKKL